MNLSGKAVVVTGAGQGLGEALAQRFTERGARVLIADINGQTASSTAKRLGAVAVQADLSVESEVLRVIDAGIQTLGTIDVYCSNAGHMGSTGSLLDLTNETWDLAWRLNVLSHIWAAKALIPRWLESEGGYLYQTVSSVALTLFQWDATYAVTKRAALAFNEYLAARYGPQGIGVTAFCPKGMKTPKLLSGSGEDSPLHKAAMRTAVEPLEAAEIAVRCIEEGRFLGLSEEDEIASHRRKAADYESWIKRRQQRSISEHVSR